MTGPPCVKAVLCIKVERLRRAQVLELARGREVAAGGIKVVANDVAKNVQKQKPPVKQGGSQRGGRDLKYRAHGADPSSSAQLRTDRAPEAPVHIENKMLERIHRN
jgi:hypothetical protein